MNDPGNGNRREVASVNSRALPWRPSAAAPRVHSKDLGRAGGRRMELLRFEAGASLTIDAGGGAVFLYVLEGELLLRGRRLWPGSAEIIGAGAAAESSSDVGCIFLRVRDGPEPAGSAQGALSKDRLGARRAPYDRAHGVGRAVRAETDATTSPTTDPSCKAEAATTTDESG